MPPAPLSASRSDFLNNSEVYIGFSFSCCLSVINILSSLEVVKSVYMLNFQSKIEQMTFSKFLEQKFLEWQQSEGGRRTVKEFAEYLGVSQSTISTWWNEDRKPEGENLVKLALKLGIEVYDALGKERPDLDLHYIQANWELLDPHAKRVLREQAERYAAQNKQRVENGQRRKPKPAG